LGGTRRVVAEEVEATLADGDTRPVAGQVAQRGRSMRVEFGRVMRMNAGRREQRARVVLGECVGLHAARHRSARHDESDDARRRGSRQDFAAVVVEDVVREVRPDIDQFAHLAPDCDDGRRMGQRCSLNS
jgi:hypothetical protein